MNEILSDAIECVRSSHSAFCRFITANDTGETGSHQSGFYIPKCAYKILFDEPGVKGENKEALIKINWQNSLETDSRAIYYGQGTRDEYRLTRFGRGFQWLNDEYIGSLLVLCKMVDSEYNAYVLEHDEDIEYFFAEFNLSSDRTNQLITDTPVISDLLSDIVAGYKDFPSTSEMSNLAFKAYEKSLSSTLRSEMLHYPDRYILDWINTEYDLFKGFEDVLYKDKYARPFDNCESLIAFANEILNRRKSRAGKSLEHHLSRVFSMYKLKFEEQVVTERKETADFIFPDGGSYHNLSFPTDDIVFLAAKTTCKDRWRQVLNEADRIEDKFLFTLQQGISNNQLSDMKECRLHLVVPERYIGSFPLQSQSDIKTLPDFILLVKGKQKSNASFLVGR
jgi:hypothetical protein